MSPRKARHFWESFGFAWQGIRHMLTNEQNFRTHLIMTVLVIVLGTWLDISRIEWLFIVFAIILMLSLETLNTAIERLADIYCNRQPDPHVRIVKDVSAAACLVGAMGAVMIGMLVFGPYLLDLLGV